jgi:uncharacterized peroxidase-related enzyme
VHQAVDDWRALRLSSAVRAMLEHVEKLTGRPGECTEADVASLRAAGWADRDIHDAVQVAAYFNYINRVADALGVKDEPGMKRWGQRE